MDPVTFLLCDPTVATTVVYKEHNKPIEFLMHYFVARELFISYALSRHFNWSRNIIFVEDLSAVDGRDKNAYSPSVSRAVSRSNSRSDLSRSNSRSNLLTRSDSGNNLVKDVMDNGENTDDVQELQLRHTVHFLFIISLCYICFVISVIFVTLFNFLIHCNFDYNHSYLWMYRSFCLPATRLFLSKTSATTWLPSRSRAIPASKWSSSKGYTERCSCIRRGFDCWRTNVVSGSDCQHPEMTINKIYQ